METAASPVPTCVPEAEEPRTLDDAVRCLAATDAGAAREALLARALAHLHADALAPALKNASERYLNRDPAIALRLAETLVALGQSVRRPDHHALGLMAVGDVFRVLGRYEESVAAMDVAHTEFNKATLLTQRGDFQAALRLCDAVRQVIA